MPRPGNLRRGENWASGCLFGRSEQTQFQGMTHPLTGSAFVVAPALARRKLPREDKSEINANDGIGNSCGTGLGNVCDVADVDTAGKPTDI